MSIEDRPLIEKDRDYTDCFIFLGLFGLFGVGTAAIVKASNLYQKDIKEFYESKDKASVFIKLLEEKKLNPKTTNIEKFTKLFEKTNNAQLLKETLHGLIDKGHIDGVKFILDRFKSIGSNKKQGQLLSNKALEKIIQIRNILKEAEDHAKSQNKEELAELFTPITNRLEEISKIQLEEKFKVRINFDESESTKTLETKTHNPSPNTPQTLIDTTKQLQIGASGISNSLDTQKEQQDLSPNSFNIAFAYSSILMVATIFKMCGLGFSNFKLPSESVKIVKDITPDKMDAKLIEEFSNAYKNSEANRIFINYISSEIKNTNKNEWTPQDIQQFVNSDNFNNFLEAAKQSERSSFKLTEEYLGAKPSHNQNTNKNRGKYK